MTDSEEDLNPEVARARVGGAVLERVLRNEGAVLIDLAGLGLVSEFLKRLPLRRAEDVVVISPERHNSTKEARGIPLNLCRSGGMLISVLRALEPNLSLDAREEEALRIFAEAGPQDRPATVAPPSVENRALALLFRLSNEIVWPTWDCALGGPHPLNCIAERLLPPLLRALADPPSAVALFGAKPIAVSPKQIILVDPGAIDLECLPMFLALVLGTVESRYLHIAVSNGLPATSLAGAQTAIGKTIHRLLVRVNPGSSALVGGAAAAAARIWRGAPATRRVADIRQLSGLRFGRPLDLVQREIFLSSPDVWMKGASLPRLDAELVAQSPTPARTARSDVLPKLGPPVTTMDFHDLVGRVLEDEAALILRSPIFAARPIAAPQTLIEDLKALLHKEAGARFITRAEWPAFRRASATHYDAGFVLAVDAPGFCNALNGQQGFGPQDDSEEKLSRILRAHNVYMEEYSQTVLLFLKR